MPPVTRILAVCVLALGLYGCGVNNIPTFEEQAKADWAQVQNQYKRRADLIPNLVETVKGFAAQERETLEAVVKARAAATQATLSFPPKTGPLFLETEGGCDGSETSFRRGHT